MSRHTLTPIERFKKALKNLDPNCKGAIKVPGTGVMMLSLNPDPPPPGEREICKGAPISLFVFVMHGRPITD